MPLAHIPEIGYKGGVNIDLHLDDHGRLRRKPSPFVPIYPLLRLTWARYWETHPQGRAPVSKRDGTQRGETAEP